MYEGTNGLFYINDESNIFIIFISYFRVAAVINFTPDFQIKERINVRVQTQNKTIARMCG